MALAISVVPAKKSTCRMPPSESLASAVSWMETGAVNAASSSGAVIATVGGRLVVAGLTMMVTGDEEVIAPAVSSARAVNV